MTSAQRLATSLTCALLSCAALAGVGLAPTTAHATTNGSDAVSRDAAAWVGHWRLAPDDWLSLSLEQGRLTGRLLERDFQRGVGPDGVFPTKPKATVVLDPNRTNAAKLVGEMKLSTGAPAALELTLEPGGQLATGYVSWARGQAPSVLQRVDGVGRQRPEPSAEQIVQRTAGVWTTPFGVLRISTSYDRGGDPSAGSGELVDSATGRVLSRLSIRFSGSHQQWEWDGGRPAALALLTPDANRLLIGAAEGGASGPSARWTATRLGAAQPPRPETPPAPTQPGPPPPAPPVVAPPPPPIPPVVSPPAPQASPATSGFKALRKFDVRVDRVVAARDAQRIDVFMTLRNATQAQLHVTSNALMVTLEDGDGVSKQNGQVLRPSEAGREHFASSPVLQPGRELRVKYSFHPDAGATPARVTVSEGDKSAEFAASAL